MVARLFSAVRWRMRPEYWRRRLLTPPAVTKADIVDVLRSLGIQPGDDVMFHSSLSSFGHVEGGADAVIDAFLEAVGPEGTVLAPSFSDFSVRHGAFGGWWNPKTTGVYTGKISDTFWRRSGAFRSDHPTHAVAAIGKRAVFYTSEHGLEGDRFGFWGSGVFSSRSPWEKMVEQDVHYMFVGCTFNVCTLTHHAETYLATSELDGLPERERRGFANFIRHLYYWKAGVWPDLDREGTGKALDAKGLVRHARLGWAHLQSVRAGTYFRETVALVRREPDKWLARPFRDWCEQIRQRRNELAGSDTRVDQRCDHVMS